MSDAQSSAGEEVLTEAIVFQGQPPESGSREAAKNAQRRVLKKSNCRMSPATPHPVPLPAGEGDGAA